MSTPLPQIADSPGFLRDAGRNLLSLFCDRIEMVAIEFQEERIRTQKKLTAAILAAVFLALGIQLLAFLVIVLCWDTYRVAAVAMVTAVYLGIGLWAVAHVRHLIHASPKAFSTTMEEFRNDVTLFSRDHD